MHVPATPEELDATWLERVLAPIEAFRDVRIAAVEARVIGVGYGLDGTVAHLTLRTREGRRDAPGSLVAKLARAGRGRDEIAFYEIVAPHVPIRLPAWYGGLVAEAGDRAVLLFEDLTGADQGDTVRGAGRTESLAVLRTMARFHAAFHGADDAALDGVRRWPGRADGLACRLRERTGRFLERYGEEIDGASHGLVARLADDLGAATDRLAQAPPTLVHSDLHVDNVLFLAPDRPVILDWPDACVGPAMIDVARFLLEGASLEVRRRHGPALLAAYAEERRIRGAPLPSSGRAAREYAAAVTWLLAHTVAWAGAEDPGFSTPRVRAIVDTLVRNAFAAALDS